MPGWGGGAYLLLGCAAFGLALAYQSQEIVAQPGSMVGLPIATIGKLAVTPGAPLAAGQNSTLTKKMAASPDPWMQLAGTALDAADPSVRLEAAHELGERGDAVSLQVLEQLLYDPQRKVRVAAMDALALRPSLATQEVLVRAIAHTDPRVRSLAEETLSELREGPVFGVSSLSRIVPLP